jgi:polysaccharide export outer membrane protein
VQQLRTRKTLVDVLSLAGGLRPDAGSKVTVQRQIDRGPIPLPNAKVDATGHFSVAEVRVRSIMTNAHPEENILIQPNDVISVPRADIVYVMGEVKKAGGFPLNERENLTVLQAVSLAEGPAQDLRAFIIRTATVRGTAREAKRSGRHLSASAGHSAQQSYSGAFHHG